MSSRDYIGAVHGGHTARFIPPDTYQQHFTSQHARGRMQSMADILLQLAWVRSSGLVPGRSIPLSSSGAKFQDFKGERGRVVMAHRALMSVSAKGKNMADLADRGAQPHLRNLLIAPQARTDPLLVVDNYADRLLEIVATPPVMALYQNVFDTQRPSRPIEVNLIVDATYRLKEILDRGYEQAAEKHRQNLAKQGYVEVKIGRPGSKPLLISTAGGSHRGFFEDLLAEGPHSPLVADRIEELKAYLFKGNPTDFVGHPELFLNLSRQEALTAEPTTVHRDQIERACAELDVAARGSSSGSGTTSDERLVT